MKKGIIPSRVVKAYLAGQASQIPKKKESACQGIIPLKKGFAYPAALFILSILLLAAAYFSLTLGFWRQSMRADLAALQARQMAESAAVYYREKQPALARQQGKLKIDLDALLALEGVEFAFDGAGFRLVAVLNDIYFVGYAGLPAAPRAVYVLYTKDGGKLQPWRE
ncbi:MAG: hypothetical protein LBD62_01815 [Candidatus Margulisbacteria bacterium]|nr:hypothetical protein [Candidatus Margulisiibacteriota bacterium]